MAFPIPTTKKMAEDNLANFENKLNQESPLNDKAFLRVLSILLAGQHTGIYKFAANRILQNLALTATNADLDLIGNNYGVPRKPAESFQCVATIPATDGTIIPVTVDFVADANGLRYANDSASTASGGTATLNLTAKTVGSAGNLIVTDTLKIGRTIPGAESTATITEITNNGVDRESDEDYRPRVLDALRTVPGGGNSADYRIWSEEVGGVKRAYPFAGKPITSSLESAPPDRTVYIEATTDIDPDGLAPQSLLDEVRDSITADPITGITRQPLGLTDDTLYVESIIRTTFFVSIFGLEVDANIEAQVKSDINTALDLYFKSVEPYVDGLDSSIDRNDIMTDASVSEVVNNVVRANGGSVESIAFDVTVGTSIPKYQLNANEKGKLGAIAYE